MKKALTLILVSFSISIYAQVGKVIDSLTREAHIAREPRQLFTIYDELVTQWAESNFDSANFYANKLVMLSKQIGEPQLKSKALLRKGTAHDYFAKYDSAIFYYKQSLINSQNSRDSVGIANAAFSLAILSQLQGNNIAAIDQYLEVERMFKSLGDERRLSRLYNNLGSIYRKTEQFDAAVQVYENSLEIKKKLNDARGILNTSINLALLYSFSGRYEDATSLSLKNLDYARQSGDRLNETSILINLGMVYTKESNHVTKDLNKGLNYLLEAERLLKESTPLALKIECWANLAGAYQSMGNHTLTSGYLKKIEMVLDQLSPDARISYFDLKTNEQLVKGNYKVAFDFLKKQTAEQNNLTSDKLKERAQELEVRYETEKKERQIIQLELAEQKAIVDREQSAWQRNFLAAMVLGLLIIVFLVFLQFRQKQISNTLLTERNQAIGHALTERETLLKEIHHRVKNNLQIISSLLSLQSKNVVDEAAQNAVNESRNRVKSMSLIHEQLYTEENVAGVAMFSYIEHLVQSLASSYGVNRDKIELNVQADPFILDVDSAIPIGLILNELVSNSLKYAFPNGQSGSVTVLLKKEGDELKLSVLDNGVGMNDENKIKNSFGLSLVNSLMRKLKAEMNIFNEGGTQVELRIRDFKIVTGNTIAS